MSYSTMPLQDHINESADLRVQYATLAVKFGDGYEQAAPSGINNKKVTWTVSFNALTEANFTTLMAFADSVKGHTSFYATPKGETQQLWRLDPQSVQISQVAVSNIDGKVYRTLQLTLNKVYL